MVEKSIFVVVFLIISGIISAQTPPKNEDKQTTDKKEQTKTQRITVVGTVLDSKEEPLPGLSFRSEARLKLWRQMLMGGLLFRFLKRKIYFLISRL